jgi:cytoskeleton protein RodZ
VKAGIRTIQSAGPVGIGPALRKARLVRGKSVEEASRETRIRAEYLKALEGERFGELLGDVYVRGFLRSYSAYLGLDADRVLDAYNRHFGVPEPALPEPIPGPARGSRRGLHPHLPTALRDHPSWTFMVGVAVLLLAIFASLGLLSRTESAPPASPAAAHDSAGVLPPPVVVGIAAQDAVEVTVRIDDGEPQSFLLHTDEVRSFEGASKIDLRLSTGGLAELTVNGESLGTAGEEGKPYAGSFRPEDFRETPSPNAP